MLLCLAGVASCAEVVTSEGESVDQGKGTRFVAAGDVVRAGKTVTGVPILVSAYESNCRGGLVVATASGATAGDGSFKLVVELPSGSSVSVVCAAARAGEGADTVREVGGTISPRLNLPLDTVRIDLELP